MTGRIATSETSFRPANLHTRHLSRAEPWPRTEQP
jgi:hypothetical protein